ncbi:unnamed protein product [Closterium sp. Yama58-4]|nr:unnamed protein product [Closterium sp. Yama58-4]
MVALPRRLSGYLVFLAAFAFLIFCHATSLDASAWRRGDIDFTGTLMIVTLKLVGAAMDCQDGSMGQQDGSMGQQDGSMGQQDGSMGQQDGSMGQQDGSMGQQDGSMGQQDGREQDDKPPRASSASPNALPRVPPLLPFLGFVFFPAAFLVGPPFPFAAYHDYVEGRGHWSTLYPHQQPPAPAGPAFPPRLLPACGALLKALLCMAVYHTLSQLLPPSALTQPAFFARPFLIRCAQVALTLFASRASNANIWVVEVTGSGAQLPSHWNIGVSNWLRTYVYDRLTPPSGKPTLTTLLVTQAVSALWHGLHPGYYLFFLSAAIAQDASKLLHRLHQSIPLHRRWQRGMARVAQMLYTRMLVGYAPLGFILLRADLTFRVWRSLYFFGSILPLLLSALLPPLIPSSNRRKKD